MLITIPQPLMIWMIKMTLYTLSRTLLVAITLMVPPLSKAMAEEKNLDDYKSFVADVGDKITDLFANKSKSMTDKKKDFQTILRSYFNIKAIGKFVLSRHWRTASSEQQESYLKLFEKALIENYSEHFNSYHNEKLQVISARTSGDKGVIVKTHVKRPQGGEPLGVDWKLFDVKGEKTIFDLVINGVSMGNSLRSEYSSLYQNSGGTIDDLLNALRKKYGNE